MYSMVKTLKERQLEYQRRQQEFGNSRLDTYISAAAQAALEQVSKRDDCTRKDAIERSIINESRKDVSTMNHPTRPSQMTAGEAVELEKFKQELPTAMLNAELNQREIQANGGEAGIAHKSKTNAMLFSNNMHHQK
jgi:hypothetical protein